jgi:sugar diacid utilization regulator
MWETGSLNHKQLLARIRLNNTVIAYLKVLEYNKKITNSDITLIPTICNILALAIEKSKYSFFIPKSPVETLIINLLKENMISELSIEEIENQLKCHLYNSYYILSFYIKSHVPDLTTKLYHMKGLINSFFYPYYTVIYNDHIVTLIYKKSPDEPVIDNTLYNSFIQLLSDNQLTAGASRCFHNIMEVSKFHMQSVKAAELGYKLNKEDSPYFYNDYAVYHLFDTCSFKENLEEFCNPLILQLINKDKDKGTSYAQSLYNYIQNNFDIQKTSNFMNVHYNTMKYRLQKIQDILQIDLNNSNSVFHINISFRILELLGYVKL